jgi:hypothetical protein
MENLEKVSAFKSAVAQTPLGIVTTLDAENEVSTFESIAFQNKTLLATNVYQPDALYKVVYAIIDQNGKDESFAENAGILPDLFLSPQQENFVSLNTIHSNKESCISIPLFNRSNTELPKEDKPFSGNFIGTTGSYSICYYVDPFSDKKPDKLLAIEFKNEAIRKKHRINIPLPRRNKIFIAGNEIHLLAKDANGWLHRQIDEKGNEIRKRTINSSQTFFREILSMSFEKDSFLLAQEDGKLVIETIDVSGNSTPKPLQDLKADLLSTWQPVRITDVIYITRFTSKTGNGWITTENDSIIELFHRTGINQYTNLVTGEAFVVEMNNPIISGLNKTKDGSYAVVFYPLMPAGKKYKQAMILNRNLRQVF